MVWGTLWAKTKLHFLRAKSALGASIVRVGFQPPPPKVDICETATLTKMAAAREGFFWEYGRNIPTQKCDFEPTGLDS